MSAFFTVKFFRRGYTDRKKKIIREWAKTNPGSSPSRPPEAIDPLRPPYMATTDSLFHQSTVPASYNPYSTVKDEPLRGVEYSLNTLQAPYAAYGYPELAGLNPYAAHHHMTRWAKTFTQTLQIYLL